MVDAWFIRHGGSVWNAQGRWQGQADPPLTDQGRLQAEQAAGSLAEAGIAHLVSSDLARARQPAAILGARLALAPCVEPALREHDIGRWSGLRTEQIADRFPEELARFREGDLALQVGGGGSRLALRERVTEAFGRLVERAEGPLALVSHLGVLRALRPGAV